MIKLYSICLHGIYMAFLLLLPPGLFAQAFKWADKMKGNYIAYNYGVIAAKDSSYYICGHYTGSIILANTTYQHMPGINQAPDSYLIKYNKNREVEWVKSVRGENYDTNGGMAADNEGNVLIISTTDEGYIEGLAGPITGTYLSKYDSDGKLIWHKAISTIANTTTNPIELDAYNNIYITSLSRVPGSSVVYEAVLLKLNADGEVLMSLPVPFYEDLAVDQAGHVYLTGQYQTSDSYIRKYNPSGQLIWEKIISSNHSAYSKNIVVDQQANLYIAGDLCGTAILGKYQVEKKCTDTGVLSIFIAKLDKDGKEQWLQSVGGEWHNRNGQLIIYQEQIYFAGIISEKGQIAGMPTLNGLGVFEIDKSGTILWFKQASGRYLLSHPVGITAYKNGLLIAGSWYAGSPGDYAKFDSYRVAGETGTMTMFTAYLEPGAESTCLTPAPHVSVPAAVCRGTALVSLTAEGEQIAWYSDAGLVNKLATGNVFQPLLMASATFYVTQTVNGCQSEAATITVQMKVKPAKPMVADVSYCKNEVPPVLTAQGQNIKWYSTADLTTLLTSGNSYQHRSMESSTIYVTQSINGCESDPAGVTILIKEPPKAPEVKEIITVCDGKLQFPLIANGSAVSWYTDAALTHKVGEGNSFFSKERISDYLYVRQQINGCQGEVARVEIREGSYSFTKEQVPNVITPNGDDKNEMFTLPDLPEGSCIGTFSHIKIYNRWGKSIYENEKANFTWNAEGLPNGIYFYIISFADYTYKGQISVMR